jgi:GNAT superfamily N-acetyltransferase
VLRAADELARDRAVGSPIRGRAAPAATVTVPLVIEPFAPVHAAGVVGVIAGVFAEYGMTFDLPAFDADLADIERSYLSRGGWFGVLTDAGRVVGTVALLPHGADVCEIKRLYLVAEYRGRGQGRKLLEHILERARRMGYREAIAWSDVRLATAHQVYARMGFEPTGDRQLDDIDRSRELGFVKRLYAAS